MKTFNTFSNQNILCELGFSGATENIFVRKSGAGTIRVLFLDEFIQVDSSRGANRRSKVWRKENFIQVLALLETLGVK
jgi:hypothetical protein